MYVIPHLHLSPHERKVLTDGFQPWRQLPDHDHDALQSVANYAEQGTLIRGQIDALLDAMRRLRAKLDEDTRTFDPAQVDGMPSKVLAKGQFPIVTDPKQAFTALRDTRVVQVRLCDRAIKQLNQFLVLLDAVDMKFGIEALGHDPDDYQGNRPEG